MYLQELIKQKKKRLKPCKTVITDQTGEKYEIVNGQRIKIDQVLPFIIDTKPDLQIAKIIPGLFLSSQDPVANLEILKEHAIKHVLSLGIEPSVKFQDINYHYIDMLDLPDFNILDSIKLCISIIHKTLHENILVHCNAGISRSSTIVIAYLMATNDLSYEGAYKIVKDVRSSIKPNDGFIHQLKKSNLRNLL
ncbi:dual specificity protein phosphatase 19-like [Cephus cinctus]|uniref:Dual specificity protein phosphatase 19-like n=1 Tax=Cephus cinctus TaxID=211228 RepID=A0AAJ7C0Q8_CEPCN|nr:dual specificity protein phosphatase 19-like [Cephus cinctus]